MKGKKVFITGGAGFIGSAIVPVLQQEGYDVYVYDNLSFGKRDFIQVAEDHFFEADILNFNRLQEAILQVQPEIIIHLAAIHFIPYCNQHPIEATRVNIEGTLNLLRISRKLDYLKRIVFASTAAVYPIADHAISEGAEVGPLDIYGLTKLTGEHLFHENFLMSGVQTVICRFFNAFGPNETNPHLIPEIERQIKGGVRTIKLGNLDPKRDFIHTLDMAHAILALLNSHQLPNFSIFNLGRGIEYSVREVVEAFSRQLGYEVKIEIDPERVRKVERMHLLADVSALMLATGWKPEKSLDDGIADLLRNG